MDHLRQLPPTDPKKPVLVPGDPEELAMKEVAQKGGIFYTTDHIVTYSKSLSYICIVYLSNLTTIMNFFYSQETWRKNSKSSRCNIFLNKSLFPYLLLIFLRLCFVFVF